MKVCLFVFVMLFSMRLMCSEDQRLKDIEKNLQTVMDSSSDSSYDDFPPEPFTTPSINSEGIKLSPKLDHEESIPWLILPPSATTVFDQPLTPPPPLLLPPSVLGRDGPYYEYFDSLIIKEALYNFTCTEYGVWLIRGLFVFTLSVFYKVIDCFLGNPK